MQALRGSLDVNGNSIAAGDGLAASEETAFRLTGGDQGAELLALDLA